MNERSKCKLSSLAKAYIYYNWDSKHLQKIKINFFLVLMPAILIQSSFCQSLSNLSEEQSQKLCNTIINPQSELQCNAFSTNNSYCCYLYLADEIKALYNNTIKNSLCLSLKAANYNKLGNFNYNNFNYRINCGLGTQVFSSEQYSQAGSKCGIINPKSSADCFAGSNDEINCCYYQYFNLTGCYSLGSKISGEITIDDPPQVYICQSAGFYAKIIKLNFYFFLIIKMLIYLLF